ncbi:MAG: hypothetical protein AB8I08_27060 [Sandaracinaceae bacterium]
MNRSTWLTLLLVSYVVLAWAPPARAQYTRRAVRAGEVTGLDMGIEGSLDALPGGAVRWFVSLYEVLRRRDLRPAPGASLEVTASHASGEVVASATTDENGLAELVIPMPDDFEDGAPEIRLAAERNGVRRVFAVRLNRVHRYEARLFVDRERVASGSTVTAFGQLIDRTTGRPAVGVPMRLTADRDDVPVHTEELVTGRAGTFATHVTVTGENRVRIRVHGESIAAARRWIQLAEDPVATMWVEARAASEVVPVGGRVEVAVFVRDRQGRPLRGARVEAPTIEEPVRTDAAGRARLSWRLSPSAPVRTNLRVTHAAWGRASQRVDVRAQRAPFAVAFSVSGGALVPQLDGRVYLRLTDARGEPLRDAEARVAAPRMGAPQTVRTDADGVARVQGPVGPAAEDVRGCGGPSAMPMRVTVAQHTESLCVPVDPDATLVLDVPSRVQDAVVVNVRRRPSVARRPVEVVALARLAEHWVPLARATLTGAEDRVELTLPPSAPGVLWVRARPRLEGGRPVRGGGQLVWRGAAAEPVSVAAEGVGAGEGARFAFAFEVGQSSLISALRAADPRGSQLALATTARHVEAVLASDVPEDVGASLVLQEGDVAAAPMPESPIVVGLLRAPWRTRARFARGRIGSMMRAVEAYVERRLPELEGCAVEERGRWRFNHAILEAAVAEAGLFEERVTALDGERLDLPGLVALAPQFTFDHVAARLTRSRMLRLLRLLRELVQRQDLDMPWARDGEVDRTLVSLLDFPELDTNGDLERGLLYDGWGRPFVLRPRRGAPSHPLLGVLPGWELVSLGPDGRSGTRDDQRDPFAQLLPDGLYAQAVGEALVRTRLEDVALGRASADALSEVMQLEPPRPVDESRASRPRRRPASVDTTAGWRPTLRASIGGLVPPTGMRWEGLSPERRAYRAVAVSFSDEGAWAVRDTRFEAGAPWAASLDLPSAMRPGEALRLPVRLIQLVPGPRPELRVTATDGLEASTDGGAVLLTAHQPGVSRVAVEVVAGGVSVAHFERAVRVVPAGSLRARHAGARVADARTFEVSIPEGATPWRALLVVAAPGAVARDPILVAQRERHPALFAWAESMRGDGLDSALSDAVGRQDAELSPLATACALSAYATDEDAPALHPLAQRLNNHLPTGISERANVLAALAAAVPVDPTGRPTHGLASTLRSLRESGWRALAVADDRPAAMARLAAALLLIDPEDSAGGELLSRAVARLEPDSHGRRWLPGDPSRPADGWVGTLALSVAARQAGRDALAESLAGDAVARLHLAPRAGEEGVFWALAAGLYGALGVGSPEQVDISVNGVSQRVALEGGIATVSIDDATRVEVRAASPVFARTEARYLRPWTAADAGRVELSIEGVSGRLGDTAGFELVVENPGDTPLPAPVLEVSLPGAALFGEEARDALPMDPVISFAEPDGAGILRLRLRPLAAHGTHQIALPIRWIASGTTEGLGVSCADVSTPWEVTRLAPRRMEIAEGTER